MIHYNNLSSYLREKYNCKIAKLCIDGGFSCPNRDGTCGTGGCIFCGERGAGEHIGAKKSIAEQARFFIERRPKAEKFIAYFQNFTNTYAPVTVLRERYDEALKDPRTVVLDIATRPDCIDEEIVKLLAEYNEKHEVWLELGLQTASDETAKRINRGYERQTFAEAMALLEKYKIKTVVHLIVGLPGETLADIKETVDYVNRFSVWGLKIHSLYVMKDTELERLYNKGEYTPLTLEEFTEAAVYILTHIRPDIVLHRITGDCLKSLLVAPTWNADKDHVHDVINAYMEENGLYQGIFYGAKQTEEG